MSNFKKRAVATLGVVAILGTSLFTSALAAGTDIKGKIADMNIFNNGTKITVPADQKPILVNDRTYLPVRALGEAIGSKVDWDPARPMDVRITSNTSNISPDDFNKLALEVNTQKIQMAEKDSKIKDLEAEIKKLKEEVKEKEEGITSSSLLDFERELNRIYGDYKKLGLDILLREKSKDIVVDIKINSRYYNDWDDLYISEQEALIKDIVYDLQKKYKDVRIEGQLDGGSRYSSYDFSTDRNGKLQMTLEDNRVTGSTGDFRAVEKEIIDRYVEVRDIIITKDESRKDIVAKVDLRSAPTRYTTTELEDLKIKIEYDIDYDLNRTLKYRIYVEFY